MNLIKTPVKGMRDFLPEEMQIREYVINKIKNTYINFGYNIIETPIVEHIENLSSNQGGENEKLIFKILKRGEKLKEAEDTDLTDSGLRYDLTLPLSRFYANNANNLSYPFKSMQIGPVFRAERPQKGRYRQFTQCDIDILGENSIMAEIDLITATSTLLNQFPINYTIRINDRRILSSMALYAGFKEEDIDKVLISLDKLDKIGETGVKIELLAKGFDDETIQTYLNLFKREVINSPQDYCGNLFNDYLEDNVIENLENIIITTKNTCNANIIFDPTLVRGMSYYTGPIFEIASPEFQGSIGGGGRYDKMISKFINISTPACGFSIGFERLVSILLEKNFKVPETKEKCAFIIEKNMPLIDILKEANTLRNQNKIVKVMYRNKNAKHQKEILLEEGYTNIKEFFNDK